jgi:hypothetical protein
MTSPITTFLKIQRVVNHAHFHQSFAFDTDILEVTSTICRGILLVLEEDSISESTDLETVVLAYTESLFRADNIFTEYWISDILETVKYTFELHRGEVETA